MAFLLFHRIGEALIRDKFEKLLNEVTQVTTLPAIFEFGNIFAPLYLAVDFESMLNPQGLFISTFSNTYVCRFLCVVGVNFSFVVTLCHEMRKMSHYVC